MVVVAGRNGRGPVILFWKSMLSLLVAMLGYWGMVTAFHLLNLPSNRAVLEGVCLLLLLVAGGVFTLQRIWTRQS